MIIQLVGLCMYVYVHEVAAFALAIATYAQIVESVLTDDKEKCYDK